ncbi:hypothetical protein DER45DRAFT_548965 [Fusarium avenaceum]|nr:hypothetical protein DER45DRAFT_548965 [Fusarium avenaceum]
MPRRLSLLLWLRLFLLLLLSSVVLSYIEKFTKCPNLKKYEMLSSRRAIRISHLNSTSLASHSILHAFAVRIIPWERSRSHETVTFLITPS